MKLSHSEANQLLRDVASTGIKISKDASEFIRIMWKTTKKKGSIELSDKQAGFYTSLRADADLAMIAQQGGGCESCNSLRRERDYTVELLRTLCDQLEDFSGVTDEVHRELKLVLKYKKFG